ncbi:MAG: DUF4147 domain-containing protein, partial [bacterium]|nr:DUF4147 domain-containing protein [bacterium]
MRPVDFEEFSKRVIRASIDAVAPASLVQRRLTFDSCGLHIEGKNGKTVMDPDAFGKCHVLGAGKGAVSLFRGLDAVLPGRLAGGIIVSLEPHRFCHPRVKFLAGSHPVPGPDAFMAGEAVSRYIDRFVVADDLVFFLLTGGASSLLAKPQPPLEAEDKISVTRLLLASGAEISEINCVRKHLSALKGGGLAQRIAPAKIVSLILSDIIGSPLEDIGSGPGVGDSTTFKDAKNVLLKYCLWDKIPPVVASFLAEGIKGRREDTPRPDNEAFRGNRHFLLGDNETALEAARQCAVESGIPTHILVSGDTGEAREGAERYAAVIRSIMDGTHRLKPPVILLSGGEFTVTVNGGGKGGRNQEFILALLAELKGVTAPFYAFSIGTDGIDGPTDAAGAWCDSLTLNRAEKAGLQANDFLNNNNSYEF